MVYQFNSFSLDANKQCLTIDGQPISGYSRAVKLIICLIEAYPEPIKKSFLHQHLWHDSVVSDSSIARLVADTRKLFNTHGYSGPLVQTLHGQGYRLATSLYEELIHHDTTAIAATPAVPANFRQHSQKYRWSIRGFLALVLVIIINGLIMDVEQTNEPKATPLKYGEPLASIGRILWVDDHINNNVRERYLLEQQQIGVYTTTNTDDALSLLSIYQYDVIISDMGRQDDPIAGLKLLQQLRQANNNTAFYLYTVVNPEKLESVLYQYGGQGVATKPQALMNLLKKHFTQIAINTKLNEHSNLISPPVAHVNYD